MLEALTVAKPQCSWNPFLFGRISVMDETQLTLAIVRAPQNQEF